MSFCEFTVEAIADGIYRHRCTVCARPVELPVDLFIRECKVHDPEQEGRKLVAIVSESLEAAGIDGDSLGLGDIVAASLERIGITKERVSKWLGSPCHCSERQKRLNQLGKQIAAYIKADRPQSEP